ncbi:MAG: TetR/AcrR family transcriptional regulator [Oscillospiraceae bacterium]|nr:TetR/AcrR family transcriptional regulator [Oscillospiraceae bacterium]
MATKGELSRERILDCARALFSEKGYSSVTMQDLCAGTGLSRGGLYRYYPSTEAIFVAILEQEQADAHGALDRARAGGVAPRRMLDTFLRARLDRLTAPGNHFDNAISEFAANSAAGRSLLIRRAEDSIRIVAEMIRLGCAAGDFHCGDPEATAAHIIWLLEGMAKHRALLPLTPNDTAAQLKLLQALLEPVPGEN